MARAAALLVVALWGPWAGRAAAQEAPPAGGADLPLLVARGDSAWLAEDHPRAFAAYDAVVRADSAFSTRALFRVGLLHAWANRFGPALAAQRLYVRLEPADLEGRIVLARTYAWASRFEPSLAQYDTVLARDAGNREATVGRAQALAWSGDLPGAERALEVWLATRDGDAQAWALLGQFRRWRGDARGSLAALDRATAIAPDDAAVREQRQWARADIGPAVSWTVVGAKDSEANTLWHRELAVQATVPARWGLGRQTRVGYVARLREASVTDGDAIVVPGMHLTAQWQPTGRAVTFRGEFGAVQFEESVEDARTQLRAGLRGAAPLTAKLRLSAGVAREPFDEVYTTASRGLMFNVGDVDASYQLTPRLQASLGATAGLVENGGASGTSVEARRVTVLGALRFTPRRGIALGVSHREVSWDEPQFGVFFAPQTWRTSELSLGWERPVELGLLVSGDLALASQGVGFEGGSVDRATVPRAAMRLGWRPVPGREVLLGLVYANVAGAGAITASDYRYGAATLTGRWTF